MKGGRIYWSRRFFFFEKGGDRVRWVWGLVGISLRSKVMG